jgi:hypothetical protein
MSPARGSGIFADRPMLTMRVSQDSGRTWSPQRAVFSTDDLAPLATAEWPPCKCRRCEGRGEPSNR